MFYSWPTFTTRLLLVRCSHRQTCLFGIRNAATSFQMELEHLIVREAAQSPILSSAAGTNVPSLRAFLESLSGEGPKYDSDSISFDASSCMFYHINGENDTDETARLTPPDLSPSPCHVAHLLEKDHLRSWQRDLEAADAELECQRRDFVRQHAQHPLPTWPTTWRSLPAAWKTSPTLHT